MVAADHTAVVSLLQRRATEAVVAIALAPKLTASSNTFTVVTSTIEVLDRARVLLGQSITAPEHHAQAHTPTGVAALTGTFE